MSILDAAKTALEALEFIPQSGSVLGFYAEAKRCEAITALRAAIAEQEKCEPVAWLNKKVPYMAVLTKPHASGGWFPVFTHPAPIPVGWRLVPEEPTEKQWAEGKIVLEAMFDCGTSIDLGLIYKVILQAAPKPGEKS